MNWYRRAQEEEEEAQEEDILGSSMEQAFKELALEKWRADREQCCDIVSSELDRLLKAMSVIVPPEALQEARDYSLKHNYQSEHQCRHLGFMMAVGILFGNQVDYMSMGVMPPVKVDFLRDLMGEGKITSKSQLVLAENCFDDITPWKDDPLWTGTTRQQINERAYLARISYLKALKGKTPS